MRGIQRDVVGLIATGTGEDQLCPRGRELCSPCTAETGRGERNELAALHVKGGIVHADVARVQHVAACASLDERAGKGVAVDHAKVRGDTSAVADADLGRTGSDRRAGERHARRTAER